MVPNKFLNRQTDLPFVDTGPADPCKFFNGNSTAICNTIILHGSMYMGCTGL